MGLKGITKEIENRIKAIEVRIKRLKEFFEEIKPKLKKIDEENET